MIQANTILIVDDESVGRDTLEGLFVGQGYRLVFNEKVAS